uniref:Uncharacterized protein n=1 Tax=Oryza punctata TaxID=4537 RepID=A0A0E0M235_ORYPU
MYRTPAQDEDGGGDGASCSLGRKVGHRVVEVIASSLRGFAYSPSVLSFRANNSRKGDGRENERSGGKKAVRRERRGAYRRPRSTTIGIHCAAAETRLRVLRCQATPPRHPRRPRRLPIRATRSSPATSPPDPCRPELDGRAGQSSPTTLPPDPALPGARRTHHPSIRVAQSLPAVSVGARWPSRPSRRVGRGGGGYSRQPTVSGGMRVAPASTSAERGGEGRRRWVVGRERGAPMVG